MHDVVAVSRDVDDEVLTSEIIVIGTVVDDDSAGHDSLEARGPSLRNFTASPRCHCLFITDSDSNEREMLFILNISDLTQCSLIVQFISK